MKHTVRRVQSTLPMPKLKKIPLSAIAPARHLVHKIEGEELSTLVESVRRHGLLQPIGVRRRPGRPARYELLFGYRRLLACRALFLPEVPCLVFPDQRERAILSLCENFQRKEARAEDLVRIAGHLSLSAPELCARLPLPCPEETEKSPKDREFSLFSEEPDEAKEPPLRPPFHKGIVRDARLIANSIERAVSLGKDAGFPIELQKIERAQEIYYHIRLPRHAENTAKILFSEELMRAA